MSKFDQFSKGFPLAFVEQPHLTSAPPSSRRCGLFALVFPLARAANALRRPAAGRLLPRRDKLEKIARLPPPAAMSAAEWVTGGYSVCREPETLACPTFPARFGGRLTT